MHDHDFDWAAMADMIEREGEAYLPYLRQAFDQLGGLAPRRVLDIGSGPGVATCLLAERFPDAEVIAVDGSAELLARARQRAEKFGVRLETVTADLEGELPALPKADLIWSAQVVHHVGDQLRLLRRLAQLLRPGGVLAIAEGGLPTRWLPRDIGIGRPGLQVRLDAVMAEWFNQMRADLPNVVAAVEDWPSMLSSAGLAGTYSRSFLVDTPAPLPDSGREFIRHTLERQRSMLGEHLDPADLDTIDRLLDPADPLGIAQRPDAFILTARTVHFGHQPAD